MNSKDNSKKQEQIRTYSEQEQIEESQKQVKKKNLFEEIEDDVFEIKEEDMVSMTYDF